MFFKKKETKTKTFGDLKKGNSAWRLMSDISSDKPYLIEVVYQGNITPNEVDKNYIVDFKSKDGKSFAGYGWYRGDRGISKDATSYMHSFYDYGILYFDKTLAIEALEKKMATEWTNARKEFEKWQRYMEDYFNGDEKKILEFQTKALQDEAKRVSKLKNNLS